MRTLCVMLAASSLFAFGCSVTASTEAPPASEDEVTGKAPGFRSYAKAAAWTSSCEGPALTQADLGAMLGDRTERALGRFEIVTRDFCSPWVNGTSSCGPSGETREAATGEATFAFGLAPDRIPSIAAWRFVRGPLLVHDEGVVLARRVGDHVAVQLVGDVSAVEIGTQREMDGRVTGSERLRGRLLSSDLVRDAGSVRGVVRAAMGSDGVSLEAKDIDAETVRWTSPPAPLADTSVAKRAYGRDRWTDSGSWTLQAPSRARACASPTG